MDAERTAQEAKPNMADMRQVTNRLIRTDGKSCSYGRLSIQTALGNDITLDYTIRKDTKTVSITECYSQLPITTIRRADKDFANLLAGAAIKLANENNAQIETKLTWLKPRIINGKSLLTIE